MLPSPEQSVVENEAEAFTQGRCTRGPRCFSRIRDISAIRLFALLFLAGGVFYFQTLTCPFLWDEYRIILGNRASGNFQWKNLPDFFSQSYFFLPGSLENEIPVDLEYYRPVPLLLHAITYQIVGLYFPAYRLESFFLHIATALLFFLLFRVVLGDSANAGYAQGVALLGTLIFYVHPRNVETVCIIANQTGLLSSFFSLLSLYLWARILKGRFHPLLYILSLAALLLGMLSKETAYGVPLLHLLVFCLCSGRLRRRNLLLLLGYFFIWIVPIFIREFVLEGPSMGQAFTKQISRQGSLALHFASVFALFLHQVCEWLLPRDIHLFQYPFSFRDLSVIEGCSAAAFLIAAVWLLRRQTALLAFAFLLLFVFYLPSSNLISIGTLPGGTMKAGSHHLYPAHVALAFLLAGLLFFPAMGRKVTGASRARASLPWFAASACIVMLSIQTIRFAAYFRTADAFYAGLLEKRPSFAGAYVNYAWHKLYIERNRSEAERILMRGILMANEQTNPKGEMDLVRNLLVLYIETQRIPEARTLLECILDRWTEDPIGSLYFWGIAEWIEKAERAQSLPGDPPLRDGDRDEPALLRVETMPQRGRPTQPESPTGTRLQCSSEQGSTH